MPLENELNAICAQLLTSEDLDVSHELFEKIQKEKIVTRISLQDKSASVRIFAVEQLYLSEITPVLHNFGFNIIDEVAYSIEKEKKAVYINRFNLELEDVKKIKKAQGNIEAVVSDALSGRILRRCRLFSLVYKQNLSIRQISLLRAVIEYIDQTILSFNYETVLSTLTSYDEIALQTFVNWQKTEDQGNRGVDRREHKKSSAYHGRQDIEDHLCTVKGPCKNQLLS